MYIAVSNFDSVLHKYNNVYRDFLEICTWKVYYLYKAQFDYS